MTILREPNTGALAGALSHLIAETRKDAARALLRLTPFVDYEESEWLRRRALQVLQTGDVGATLRDGGHVFTITYAGIVETVEV